MTRQRYDQAFPVVGEVVEDEEGTILNVRGVGGTILIDRAFRDPEDGSIADLETCWLMLDAYQGDALINAVRAAVQSSGV